MPHVRRLTRGDDGFTLIELMIVVAIIAILAAVAVVAYIKHIKSSRLTAERNFVSAIMAQQETHYQRYGFYLDASGGGTAVGTPYPLGTAKFEAKEWKPDSANDNQPGWMDLGAHPEQNVTYFQWLVEASHPDTANPANAHQKYGRATQNGIPDQPVGDTPHAWYYIEGYADMDSNASNWTVISASSARPEVRTANEGQ
jgi:prepilin-type N-terminal cleavage/methylation domain-containing protein